MHLPPSVNGEHVFASGCNAPVLAVFNTPDRIDQVVDALSLPTTKLSNHQVTQLKSLIAEFSDVFALSDAELSCTGLIRHSIDTSNHAPIKQRPYRTPIICRALISEMVDNMHKQGIVQPSVSPWASPIVLVPKRERTHRFCISVNKYVYPLSRINNVLDTLGESKFFSSFDLVSGYWQVELDAESCQKAAFTKY